MQRQEWLRACRIAREGGTIRPTLPNLVAAWRIVHERNRPMFEQLARLAIE